MGKFLDSTGLTKLVELIKGSLPGKATSSTLGLVKPDNSTITVDSNGIISSSSSNSYTFTTPLVESSGTVSLDVPIKKGTGVESISESNGSASGKWAHAEGEATYAVSQGAHAEGRYTNAGGLGSHAEGFQIQTKSNYQHAEGKYNVLDPNSMFQHIAGNGTGGSARSNLFARDWDGNGYYAGNLYVGCSDYTTASGPALNTTNCGGQKVFYGSLVSTETNPTVNGAINWVYG